MWGRDWEKSSGGRENFNQMDVIYERRIKEKLKVNKKQYDNISFQKRPLRNEHVHTSLMDQFRFFLLLHSLLPILALVRTKFHKPRPLRLPTGMCSVHYSRVLWGLSLVDFREKNW